MRHRQDHPQSNDIHAGHKDANLEIPILTLSTLVSMIAIAKWVVCDHDAMINPGFRRAVQYMEQLVYEQSHHSGGADEIWKDPEGESYHHPTFPEQQGDAWEALESYNGEVLRTGLIEIASRIMADRAEALGRDWNESQERYEHQMMDVVEQQGVEELLRVLIA